MISFFRLIHDGTLLRITLAFLNIFFGVCVKVEKRVQAGWCSRLKMNLPFDFYRPPFCAVC
jgi:hypothetical protein